MHILHQQLQAAQYLTQMLEELQRKAVYQMKFSLQEVRKEFSAVHLPMFQAQVHLLQGIGDDDKHV